MALPHFYKKFYHDIEGYHPWPNNYFKVNWKAIDLRLNQYLSVISRFKDLTSTKDILDYCSGSGAYSISLMNTLPSSNITCVDYSKPNVRLSRSIKWLTPDKFLLTEERSFDLILVRHGLEHMYLADAMELLSRLSRYIREDGLLCVVVPHEFPQHQSMSGHAPHLSFFSESSITKLITKSGWDVTISGYFGAVESLQKKYTKPLPRVTIKSARLRRTYLHVAGFLKIFLSYLLPDAGSESLKFSHDDGAEIFVLAQLK
jgi:SAM-dependent methyltransferase